MQHLLTPWQLAIMEEEAAIISIWVWKCTYLSVTKILSFSVLCIQTTLYQNLAKHVFQLIFTTWYIDRKNYLQLLRQETRKSGWEAGAISSSFSLGNGYACVYQISWWILWPCLSLRRWWRFPPYGPPNVYERLYLLWDIMMCFPCSLFIQWYVF